MDVRLALSYDDLNITGTLYFWPISATFSATVYKSSWFSITHGPRMKNGRPCRIWSNNVIYYEFLCFKCEIWSKYEKFREHTLNALCARLRTFAHELF